MSLSGLICIGPGSGGGGCQMWYRFPWKIIISLPVIVRWKAHQQLSSMHWRSGWLKCSEGGRWRHSQDPFGSVLGLGEGGCQMWYRFPWKIIISLPVIVRWKAHQQLSSMHWCSMWLKSFRRGGGDVTTRTHWGRSWVKGRGDVRCGADFHEKLSHHFQ